MKLGISYHKLGLCDFSRVAERLLISELRTLGNIRKMIALSEDIAQFPVSLPEVKLFQ